MLIAAIACGCFFGGKRCCALLVENRLQVQQKFVLKFHNMPTIKIVLRKTFLPTQKKTKCVQGVV